MLTMPENAMKRFYINGRDEINVVKQMGKLYHVIDHNLTRPKGKELTNLLETHRKLLTTAKIKTEKNQTHQ